MSSKPGIATPLARDYGLPFSGYNASVRRQLAQPDEFTQESRDWLFDATQRCWVRRSGSVIVGDSILAPAGLVESKFGSRSRKLMEWRSPSLTDGYPTHAVLLTDETDAEGQVYIRSTNGAGTNRVLGQNFSSDYPVNAGTAGPMRFKALPLYTDHAQGLTRFRNSVQRRLWAAGSRNVVEIGDRTFFPNLQSTPAWSNRRHNDGTVTDKERLMPWGHIPPLWLPNFTKPGATAVGTESWKGTGIFAYAVAFIDFDGSWSMPFMPRGQNAILANGYGYYSIDSSSSVNKYAYITWNNIPIGPTETTWGRALLRTTQGDLSVAGTSPGQTVPIDFLQVAKIIPNNTQTSYQDYNGSDTNLRLDPVNVRTDHMQPPRARYGGIFDEHILLQYLKVNPTAAYVCQRMASGGTMNNGDDDGLDPTGGSLPSYSTMNHVYILDDQTLVPRKQKLWCNQGANSPSAPLICDSSLTIQDVIDKLLLTTNATTTTAYGDWKGIVAPGADPLATADNLMATAVYLKVSTTLNSATVSNNQGQNDGNAGSLTNVRVGMMVSGAGIPAGSFVGSITGDTSFTLVDVSSVAVLATANGTPNLTIGYDVGDSQGGTPHIGSVRCWGNSYPAPLYFNAAYLARFAARKSNIIFTGGGPTHARLAVNNFYVKNELPAPGHLGIGMGIGGLPNFGVLCYSRGIAVIRNTFSGGSGADQDYRIQVLNPARGCISPYSVVVFNGAVGYLTPDGYVVTDGVEERLISLAVYNPSTKVGEWGDEIALCEAAAEGDTDNAMFFAWAENGRLHVRYRVSGDTSPTRRMVYDFSPRASASGLAQLVSDDGKPFGWSTVLTDKGSAMGSVRKSDGNHHYAAVDSNAGSTGDGRVDEMDTGTYDVSEPVSLLSVTTTINVNTMTGPAGNFADIAVGAVLASFGNFPTGTTVTAINTDASIATMSVGATSTGTTIAVFYGKTVRPVGYHATDLAGTPHLKRGLRLYAMYRKDSAGMSIGIARDQARSATDTQDLPAQASGVMGRVKVEIPVAGRARRDSIELAVRDNGRGTAPEWYGARFEGEILNFPA